MDEILNPLYKTQLLLNQFELVVCAIGDPGFPPKGTLDPEILRWCEENNFILVTNNRKSMPAHLEEHLSQGHHISGIITLNEGMSVGETIQELVFDQLACGWLSNQSYKNSNRFQRLSATELIGGTMHVLTGSMLVRTCIVPLRALSAFDTTQ